MGFALTEVGVGVNAKKIQAYVEEQEDGSFRLFADGPRNKLWITSARHGGLLGLVARIGRTSKKLGLFVIEVPDQDIQDRDYSFWLKPSGVDAFKQNYNPWRWCRGVVLLSETRSLHVGCDDRGLPEDARP
jgi:alkylation response protein AidB-like acyl-CoA dehydrogenase